MNVRAYMDRRTALSEQIHRAETSGYRSLAESLRAELATMPPLPPSTFFCGFCGSERHKAPRCPKLI